jgi:hypothetical protein
MDKLIAPSLEKLIDEWDKDSVIDLIDASREILRIPVIHSKYNKYMTLHTLSAKKTEIEYSKVKRIKWMYYSGKLSQEELNSYGWEPFTFTLKSDINVYIDGDEDLSKILRKIVYHEQAATYCNNVMKELNNRTWQLKEHMTHERFINAQH